MDCFHEWLKNTDEHGKLDKYLKFSVQYKIIKNLIKYRKSEREVHSDLSSSIRNYIYVYIYIM